MVTYLSSLGEWRYNIISSQYLLSYSSSLHPSLSERCTGLVNQSDSGQSNSNGFQINWLNNTTSLRVFSFWIECVNYVWVYVRSEWNLWRHVCLKMGFYLKNYRFIFNYEVFSYKISRFIELKYYLFGKVDINKYTVHVGYLILRGYFVLTMKLDSSISIFFHIFFKCYKSLLTISVA